MRYKHIHTLKSNYKTHLSTAFPYGYRLLILSSLLALFGLFALLNVSLPTAMREFNDKYYFVKEQAKWIVLGLLVMISVSYAPITLLKKISFSLWIINVLLLILVLIPGFGINVLGASRWLSLGPFQIQPAEFMKLSITLYLASYISKRSKLALKNFLVIVGISIFPILLQPDMGTAVVIALISGVIYFVSGTSKSSIFILLISFVSLSILFSILAPYRLSRLSAYINPFADPLGSTYHIRQILIALGSGGLFGVGLGKSIQKYAYIPEMTTDSIFSVLGEEVGFIGLSILILILLLILYYGYKISTLQTEIYQKILSFGLISILGIQIIINISAMVSLIPLTGIPLPFISYGGSNLLLSCVIIGLLAGISKNNETVK